MANVFPHRTNLLTFESIENYTLDDTPPPFEIEYYMSTTEGWICVPPPPKHCYDVNCSIPTIEVWTLNLKCPDQGWKFAPSMKYLRLNPQTIVIDGKLYVLGSIMLLPP